jgi:hypothetical protein
MLYKSSLNFNNNRATDNYYFEMFRNCLCNVWWLAFLSFWPPLLLGALTFSFLIHFQQLFTCQMHQEEGFKICLDQNQRSPPLGSGLPWAIKCLVIDQSTLHDKGVLMPTHFCRGLIPSPKRVGTEAFWAFPFSSNFNTHPPFWVLCCRPFYFIVRP